ncbi:MAG: Zn-dependent oxidoreductase [Halolamina sp.]
MSEDSASPTCTLSDEDAQRRRDQLPPVLAERFDGATVHDEGRVTLRFEGVEGPLSALASFVTAEHECCSFATYDLAVEPPYEATRLEVDGPDGTAEMFREGFIDVLGD